MQMRGSVIVHKTDNATRHFDAVSVNDSGVLSGWDNLSDDNHYRWIDVMLHIYIGDGEPNRGSTLNPELWEVIEPDVIATSEQYDRVEREGHSWKMHTAQGLKDLARRRDDVDEEELPDNI